MKYIYIQGVLFVLTVLFLYYFLSQDYFLPQTDTNKLIWGNLVIALCVLTLSLESMTALIIYIIEKLFLFNKPEWPSIRHSLKWGLVISVTACLILILNILHLIALPWGLAIAAIIVVVTFLLK